jgi:hypothetical protein
VAIRGASRPISRDSPAERASRRAAAIASRSAPKIPGAAAMSSLVRREVRAAGEIADAPAGFLDDQRARGMSQLLRLITKNPSAGRRDVQRSRAQAPARRMPRQRGNRRLNTVR